MKQEYNIEHAIAAAEAEGMVGKVQPLPGPRRRVSFDELALIRAAGEGMYQRTPQRILRPGKVVSLVGA